MVDDTVVGGQGANDTSATPATETQAGSSTQTQGSQTATPSGQPSTAPNEDVKRFQAQYTKASQELARIKKQLQSEQQKRAEYERQIQASQRQSPQGSEDVFADLRKLPYLSGEDAVGVVQSIASQIRERDQILLGALNEMKAMRQVLGQLQNTHLSSSFDSKINRWIKDGGYPEEDAVRDLMKEIYLAYEGDDLDEEFPGIFKARWDAIQKVNEAVRAAKVQAARKQPFLPGKGGQAVPSKPLQLKHDLSSRAFADQLFDTFGNDGSSET